MAGPGGALLADARGLLATIEVPSLPFNPATLPPVDEPERQRIGNRPDGRRPIQRGAGRCHVQPVRAFPGGVGRRHGCPSGW